MAYIDSKLCCWLAASALCVVNKVLLFKHVQAWLFSFPLHIASESLGPVLGTVQSEKHRRMLVLMPATWSTVHSLVLMLLFDKGTAQDGLALRAAFLLTPLWAFCYFRTQSEMRSKQQNKFDVPAASRGENIYCFYDQPFMIWLPGGVETPWYYQGRGFISVRPETLTVHNQTVFEKSISH